MSGLAAWNESRTPKPTPQTMAAPTAADLARLMVGRKVLFQIEKKIQDAGEVVLGVRRPLHALEHRRARVLEGHVQVGQQTAALQDESDGPGPDP